MAVVRPKWRGKTVCFEVKVSRADFLSDIRTEKWRKYASVFDLLYFAVPAGLVDRREVPKGVGLVVHDGGDWEVAKQANSRSYPDTDRAEVLMSVLLNKHPASWKREPSC